MRALNHNIRNAVVQLGRDVKVLPAGLKEHARGQLRRIETALAVIDNMYFIKNLDVLNLHPLLKEIVEEVKKRWGLDVITSAFRPGDGGVHGTKELRGIDLRLRDDAVGREIEDHINAWYQYDPKRPGMNVAIYHDVGLGKHLHLQVHPRTRKKSLNTNGRFPA